MELHLRAACDKDVSVLRLLVYIYWLIGDVVFSVL